MKNQNVLPVVIARMDSSRMPGKVLRPLLDGESVINRVVEQIEKLREDIEGISDPIIATTSRVVDEPIAQSGKSLGVEVFTGSVAPLSRMCALARLREEAWLWRLNADSPLILTPLIQHAVTVLANVDNSCLAVNNLAHRTFPYGISLELYRTNWLEKLEKTLLSDDEKEHITPLLKRLTDKAVCGIVSEDLSLPNFDPKVRLTIDHKEDAEFFYSLWQLQEFKDTAVGSLNRVMLAYGRRSGYEI